MQQTQTNKTHVLYDTFVTRNSVLALIKLQNDKEEFRKYVESNLLSKWNNKDSSTTRNQVFLDFCEYLWLFMIEQQFSVEQMSTIFSIAFHVFMDSLDKKVTQTESFQILQEILAAQTLVTNNKHIPIFSIKDTQAVEKFFKEYFYKYYSLYEITMTKFIDVNIYTQNPINQYKSFEAKSLELHEEKDPQNIPVLEEYLFAEEFQEGEEDDFDDEQNIDDLDEDQNNNEDGQQDPQINLGSQVQHTQMEELDEKDKKIANFIDDKLQEFNNTLELKKQDKQEQLDQNVQNILFPPKK